MKNKQFEQWALPVVKKAMKVMMLEHFYPVSFDWKEEIRGQAIAGFSFTHPYQSFTIQYTDGLLKEWRRDVEEVKRILVHEASHALTDPLYNAGWQRFASKDQLEDEREKLTDHIANIILKNGLV